MLICHLYTFFNEVPVQIFCPFLTELFVHLLLSFKNSLYILDTRPFSDMCLANIFAQSVACLFILLIIRHFSLLYFSSKCLNKEDDGEQE